MRKGRFSEEQIIGILKQSEAGKGTKEICREHGISPNTFYAWRRKFGGMEVADAQKLRRLENENRKLKEVVADLTLDKKTLEFMLSKKP
jgi:putative transposase